MKLTRTKTVLISILTIAALVLPQLVHADYTFTPVVGPTVAVAANISWLMLIVANIFLRITAQLLNLSLYYTTHIADLVKQMPVIEAIWKIIRDFSSIFLIFMLLYAAITMILGLDGPNFKKLVISIFAAGLLINFSLFFTKIAIDTSNVVALSFYKAIDGAGAQSSSLTASDNGIANAVMQGLRLQTVFSATVKNAVISTITLGIYTDPMMVIVSICSIIISIMAGLSFLAAAVMFIVRLIILIGLLAFSPIFFIGMVLPDVQPKAKELLKILADQCIFAPLYLMIMYVGLRILLAPEVQKAIGILTDGGAVASTLNSDITGGTTVASIFMYALVFIVLNLALVTSKKYAGVAGEWGGKVSGWAKKTLANNTYGYAGRRIVGQLGSTADKALASTPFGNSRFGRELREITTGAAAKGTYGGTISFKDDEKLGKEIKAENRKRELKAELTAAYSSSGPDASDRVKAALGKMSSAEKQALSKDALTNALVMKHLGGSTYSAVEKSDRGDKEKTEIQDARKAVLTEAVGKGDTATVKNLIKNLDKTEVADTAEDALKTLLAKSGTPDKKMVQALIKGVKGSDMAEWDEAILTNENVAVQLTSSQLKEMETLSEQARHKIGSHISSSTSAVGRSYVTKEENRFIW
jgi:uncharacterized protein (UPF0335 family)